MNTNTFNKRTPVPKDALIKPYYSTVQVEQNVAELSFFPANASKAIPRDNYITNGYPGNNTRRVAGISFEILKQFISKDSGNSIDPQAIVNALKDASIILTADSNYVQFSRTVMDRHANFSGTGFEAALAAVDIGGAVSTVEEQTVIMKSSSMYRLPDPFDIAPNQTVDLTVKFADASNFPTDDNWNDSGQGLLYLRATLYLAEIQAQA